MKEYKREMMKEGSRYCSWKKKYVKLVEEKKHKWQEKELEHTHYLLKQNKTKKNKKKAAKIWVTDKNVLKKHLNNEALNSESHLQQFSLLFTKADKGSFLNEVQILGPDYTDESDDDVTSQEITKCILSTKNKKGAGCDGTPDAAQKIFLSNAEWTEILTKLFNTIRSKRAF